MTLSKQQQAKGNGMKMQDCWAREDQMKNLIKNDYFFFSGENATCGTANESTGNYDKFGTTYRFKTKAEAIDFYNASSYAPSQKIGKVSTIRQFHLGTSVVNFHEYLNDLEYQA